MKNSINKIIKRVICILAGILCAICSYSQTWSDVGGGTNNVVEAMEVYQNKLIVTGGDTFGNLPIYAVASWDGSQWDSLGGNSSSLIGGPNVYGVYNNELYAGNTWLIGVGNTYLILRWNGTNWYNCVSNNNTVGIFHDMIEYNGSLYVAGNITKIGGVNVNRIAKWNGSNWSNVGGGVTGGFGLIQCTAVYNGQLYVGGDFGSAGGKATYNIARWNGLVWDSVGCAGFNDVVVSMVVDTIRNVLYVGGSFTLVGNTSDYQPLKYIARWNDTTWSQVGHPFDNTSAFSMEMYHNDLYIAGNSPNSSVNDTIIARWNGTNWYWVQGPNNTVLKLEVYKDTLYVGGSFTTPGSYIASYFSPLTTVNEEKKSEIKYLDNNFPNPFKNTTLIPYFVPEGCKGIIYINDINGKQIKTYNLNIGKNKLEVSLAGFGNGMYFYTLNIDNGRIIRHNKMIKNQ